MTTARAVALVDGEHYAPVVREALAGLPYEVVSAVLLGGTEKLRDDDDYGVPLEHDLERALAAHEPDLVFDLSDEPVLGPRERLGLASRVLARGVAYVGPDFRFEPPPFHPFPLPSLAVIGTGKRVGKTAVTCHVARLLARELDVVAVAMGRGGPAEPEVVETPPSPRDLVERSRAGAHAASDYLEIAALAGVVAIGCRRAGGGLAGATAASNVLAGAALAAERKPDLVLFDGSGAAIPPIAVDRRILVAGSSQDATAGLNPYRILVSDLVVLTSGDESVRDAVRAVKDVPVVRAELRLRPLEPLAGRTAAVFTTGAIPTDDVDGDIVAVSRALADRRALREDLERIEAEVYVIELKAAAIDVVAETAFARGADVVFAANDVEPLPGEPELDAAITALAAAGAAA